MQVPFIDLKAQYQTIKSQIDAAMSQAVSEFSFIKGRQVVAFEKNFAALLKVNHAVATANGTDSLFLALKALNLNYDDEVMTPAWSCIPSAEAVSLCGHRPVFIDVDEKYLTIDVNQVARNITPKTKAIIAVHLYGQAAPVEELRTICDQANITLIEDCAQGHLTSCREKFAGSWGRVNAFSFYPTKNLGAYGDAGCVTTNDAVLAERIRRLANHGALAKDDHQMEGTNSRMDTIQAAILLTKMHYLAEWTETRKRYATQYTSLLQDVPEVSTPLIRPNSEHSFHIYSIRAKRRDELKKYLHEQGVETMIHYPRALTNMPFYNLSANEFPVANKLERQVLSLPIYPELKTDQIEFVAQKIRSFYKS